MKIGVAAVVLAVLLALSGPRADAVNLSIDPAGQVLILPLFLAGSGYQTIFEIRNKDSRFGKAVRLVVKDPVLGRPTLSLNIYLAPNDSWSSALHDPTGMASIDTAQATLLRWSDASCTLPALEDIPSEGLALSDRFLPEVLGELSISGRLGSGFVEIYEMGSLDAALAADCEEIAERWSSGAWSREETRNDGVSAPTGSLEAYAAVINGEVGLPFHFEALVLDGFRDSALHGHPDDPRHPSLADVSPAESRILESVSFANRTIQIERVSSWTSDPVKAVDAVLMTESVRSDFSSVSSLGAQVSVLLTFPTRSYHADGSDFYGSQSDLSPFPIRIPPAADESLEDNRFQARALNREGRAFELSPNPGNVNCDQVNASLVNVFLVDFGGFTRSCDFNEAEFRLSNSAREGELEFEFEGRLVSDEGHVFRGLPVYGVLLQSLTNGAVILDDGRRALANYGWARIMKVSRNISDPE